MGNKLKDALMALGTKEITRGELVDAFLEYQRKHPGFMATTTVKELIEYAESLGFTVDRKKIKVKAQRIEDNIDEILKELPEPGELKGLQYYLNSSTQDSIARFIQLRWENRFQRKAWNMLDKKTLAMLLKYLTIDEICLLYNVRQGYIKERVRLLLTNNNDKLIISK